MAIFQLLILTVVILKGPFLALRDFPLMVSPTIVMWTTLSYPVTLALFQWCQILDVAKHFKIEWQ